MVQFRFILYGMTKNVSFIMCVLVSAYTWSVHAGAIVQHFTHSVLPLPRNRFTVKHQVDGLRHITYKHYKHGRIINVL